MPIGHHPVCDSENWEENEEGGQVGSRGGGPSISHEPTSHSRPL